MANILVVDDDPGIQKMLSEILTDKGYSVKCIGTGKGAIAESFKQLYNLALIDIRLPDMEGTEILSKLRSTEPPLIKIIITGNATLDNSIKAANKGVDGYIVKPFDPEKLISMIESKLKEQQKKIQFDEKKVAEYIELRHQWMASNRFKK